MLFAVIHMASWVVCEPGQVILGHYGLILSVFSAGLGAGCRNASGCTRGQQTTITIEAVIEEHFRYAVLSTSHVISYFEFETSDVCKKIIQ